MLKFALLSLLAISAASAHEAFNKLELIAVKNIQDHRHLHTNSPLTLSVTPDTIDGTVGW